MRKYITLVLFGIWVGVAFGVAEINVLEKLREYLVIGGGACYFYAVVLFEGGENGNKR